MMQAEGAFSRLLDLLRCGAYHNTPFHKLLLDLLCDMSRIQRLSPEDLGKFSVQSYMRLGAGR